MNLVNLSVVIPVSQEENFLGELLQDLNLLPHGSEFIFVGSEISQYRWKSKLSQSNNMHQYIWVIIDKGRAAALNAGAKRATKEFIWFLHADCRFSNDTLSALAKSLAFNIHALHYFRLKFLKDGPWLVNMNEFFAYIRSHILGIPFGDQGFCLSNKLFHQLGGYPEAIKVGEDHLFVWRAKQKKVKLQHINAPLLTSARKYQKKWLSITISNQFIWITQSMVELIKLIKLRIQS